MEDSKAESPQAAPPTEDAAAPVEDLCPEEVDAEEANEAAEIAMCDSCYNSAIELEAEKGDDEERKCDVCELRRQLADSQKQVADLEARLAEYESGQTKTATDQPPDARPHFMAISDGIFAKLRKNPYNLFLQMGKAPRSLWRTKATGGLDGMLAHLLGGLDRDQVEGRAFHVLWFGGLSDTTKDDYERVAYIAKLKEALEKIRDHAKCLSVAWATLPETAFNAEAREINELMADWVANTPWMRLLDLRYISRREGTMETKEAIWTQKGSQLVAESLRKFLGEKLELSAEDLKAMEDSAKEMQAENVKRQSAFEEQRLRKQQKLAKAALLRAGHAVPGTAAQSQGRKRGGKPRTAVGPSPRKFPPNGAAANGGPKFANGAGGPQRNGNGQVGRSVRQGPAPFPKVSPFPMGPRVPDYGSGLVNAAPRLPAASNRINADYVDETRFKRARYSEPAYETRAPYSRYGEAPRFDGRGPIGVAGYGGDLYSRREDPFRRSPPKTGFGGNPMGSSMPSPAMAYAQGFGNGNGAYMQNGRRPQQWESYDRVPRR